MLKRYFTPNEIDFLKENFIQYGAKYCANHLKRNIPYVAKKAYALGLKRKDSDQWKIDKSQERVEMTPFYKITKPSVAYILGFIWADGYVSKIKNRICIAVQNQDGKDLKEIFHHHIPFHLHMENKKCQHMFYLNDFRLHNFLVKNDYLVKSTATPSKILSHIPKRLQHYFFRGFFDGDGCLTNNKNHCLSFTGSYDQDWTSIIKMIGDVTGVEPKIIRRSNDKRGHKNSFVYLYNKERVKKVLSYLYSGEQMGLSRKSHLSHNFVTSP